jgi:hypothetical protein
MDWTVLAMRMVMKAHIVETTGSAQSSPRRRSTLCA